MDLRAHIAETRAGAGDPATLLGEFRRAAVLVPTAGQLEDRLLARSFGGVHWILAFTDEAALAQFAGRSGAAPDQPWPYVSVLGARLLDVVIPALGRPAGVAVDLADEEGSMLFPPAPGIVPAEVAVHGTDGEEAA
ncbi:SseB family protein [Streptomyces qinglanensis]|uniref:SseB family protein n=1 Tax=Streptomyces qinglanensis TaxID=943816 RepID=UPI0037A8CFE6